MASAVLMLLSGACAPREAVRAPEQEPLSKSSDPFVAMAPCTRYTLRNGLTVVLNEDHRVPMIAVRVVYRVGSADDPAGRAELAHLTQALLFRGSRNVPAGKYNEYLQAAGAARVGGVVSIDTTQLFQLVPANQLALALWLESDRMAFGLEGLSETDVEREGRVLLREWALQADVAAELRVSELMHRRLFEAAHPYHSAFAAPELAAITLEEVRAFYRARYGPSSALLILSGDFVASEAERIVAHYFADLPGSAPSTTALRTSPTVAAGAPDVPAAAVPATAAPSAALVRVEAATEAASVRVAWASPALFAQGDAELDIVARFLHESSLRALVGERLAFDVWARQASWHRAGVFTIGAALRPGVAPETALAAIDAALEELRQASIPFGRVVFLGQQWLADIFVNQDDLLERTFLIAESQLNARNPHFLYENAHRYRGVTSASIADVVARYLTPQQRVAAIVTPNPNAPAAGRLIAER